MSEQEAAGKEVEEQAEENEAKKTVDASAAAVKTVDEKEQEIQTERATERTDPDRAAAKIQAGFLSLIHI